MVPTSVAGGTCQRCGTPLADLGWAACLHCLARAPTTTVEDAPIIDGFEALTVLGRGGMGVIYRAYQPRLDRHVAIKVIDPGRADDPRFRERFAREARLMARLAHPNVAAVYDYGERDDCYLVMELVDGAPLARMPFAAALPIIDALCDALVAAHALGIVHRDIKPSNVLVRADGTVKLIDFGIATLADDAAPITRSGQLVGTPAYMAPEAQRGAKPTPAVDVFAVAMLVREISDDVPARIERVLARALSGRPGDRPSMRELQRTLRRAWPRRSLRGLALVAIGLALVAGTSQTRESLASAARAPASASSTSTPSATTPSATTPSATTPSATTPPTPQLGSPSIRPRPKPRATPKRRPLEAAPSSATPSAAPDAALAPGTLVVRVRPWGFLSIDGAPAIRVEPPSVTLPLAAGRHTVELSNPVTQQRAQQVLTLAAGEARSITANLEVSR